MNSALLPQDYPEQFAEWTRLLDAGSLGEAESHYFERILPGLVPYMRARSGRIQKYDGLISLLGFTPETTVLSYFLLSPPILIALHTPETEKSLSTVQHRTKILPEKFFHESFLHDDEHTDDILVALKRALSRFKERSRIAIEITGGKKTMSVQIATALISIRQIIKMDLDIVYIDYDEYMQIYRKPKPETTRILVLPDNTSLVESIFQSIPPSENREILVDPIFSGRNFEIDEKMVFVLMPFTLNWSDRVWIKIKSICESIGLQPKRADDLFGDYIIEDIWKSICQARVIIAELTAKNANVFYELGLSHAVGKRFILIAQDINDVPFDLRHLRCLIYADNTDGFFRLEKALIPMLKERAPT